jgi:hypothetical protein
VAEWRICPIERSGKTDKSTSFPEEIGDVLTKHGGVALAFMIAQYAAAIHGFRKQKYPHICIGGLDPLVGKPEDHVYDGDHGCKDSRNDP